MRVLLPILGVILVFWATRLAALDTLPLHNDEGLHLTRAVEVWNLHPFWQISDGKIVNHWLIAAFYPQHAPVFAGRVATLFVAVVGLAAGWAVARRLAGENSALLAGALWVACPYLFFYERLALSDAEAGALVVLTLWAALRLNDTNRTSDAVLTGLCLAAATLFKFTAVPFTALVVFVVLGLSRAPVGVRVQHLVVIGVTVAACFAVPLGYLALRGGDFFATALGWIGGGSGGENGAGANVARLGAVLVGFGSVVWTAIMLIGLALLPYLRQRGIVLLLALLVPLGAMITFGSEVLPRHYVVALPLALVLGGAGFSLRLNTRAVYVAVVLLAVVFVPFAAQAYIDPGSLPLPDATRTQYITDHSAGYGLREAVLDLPRTITDDTPIVASMFPDSCRRANFYAVRRMMICTDAPGREAIEAALDEHGAVYVLTDDSPSIGIDITTVDAQAQRIVGYPRPGEDESSASVVLWRIQH